MNTQKTNTKILVNVEQAETLLKLIQDKVDFSKLNIGEVLQLNMITVQLEEIKKGNKSE